MMEELEDAQAELAVFARLLAMESDLKEWVEKQIQNADEPSHMTDEMLDYCEDHCTAVAQRMNKEVLSLLKFLDNYWKGTAEVRVDEN